MKWTFKNIMLQLFATHAGRLVFGMALLFISACILNIFDTSVFWLTLALIGTALFTFEGLIYYTIYSVIIRVITNYKNRKNK